ncbi:LysE family translocator [Photobacterium profundum]|uniref:LysE family translocator n=1 Tax=Photobacterium profundum TaxID=74109 RepID=UPI003D11BE1F
MDYLLVVTHVVLIWILAVITPGANVLLTINTALHYDRKLATFSAFGVSSAILLWALFGGSGLVILFSIFPQLFWIMKFCGGSYLLYLGIRQIYRARIDKNRANTTDVHQAVLPSKRKVFFSAFITSILNPKTGFFVVSLFSVSMPPEITVGLMFTIMLIMSSITLCWHLTLAEIFSHNSAKGAYSRISSLVDYVTGGLFAMFGLRVMML